MVNVLKWFLVGVSFLILSACGGGGGGNKIPIKKVIKGYVVDDPIQNANISIFTTDGKLLKDNIKSNVDGYFEIKLDNVPNEYIIYSNGGQMNGTAFDGELFSFCQSSTCNLTPLSTVTYQYANSLLNGTFTEKYAKAKTTIRKYLGVSDDDIHKISGVSSFKFNVFRELVKNEGFAVVVGGLVNDLVDGYIDDENNQKLFNSYLVRVELPLPSKIETVKDENGKDVTLTVHGADGADYSKGFLIDTVATQKSTVVNDDAQEVKDDETVFLGLNLGEYKGKLNSETTVLAKLFMSDMGLTLLPNDAKESLIHQLKTENSKLYKEVIDRYKFVLENGVFYEPLFDEKFNLLVGKAQVILSKTTKKDSKLTKIQSKQTSLRKKVLLYSSYKENRQVNNYYAKEGHVEKTLSPYLNIDYDDQNHSFSIKNRLPIFFGIRETKDSYATADNWAIPLIQPAQGGAIGVGISRYYSILEEPIEWTTGIKLSPETTFYGEILAPSLFPSATEISQGRKEFEIFKTFGLNSPTFRNVGLGVKSVLTFLSGSGVSDTFNKAIAKTSKVFETSKKVLKYAQSGVDISKAFSQFLYLTLDERIKNAKKDNLSNKAIQSFINKSNFFKAIYKTSTAEEEIIKSMSDFIPDSSSIFTKNKAGHFITSIGLEDNKVFTKGSVYLAILNHIKKTKGELTQNDKDHSLISRSQATSIIVIGKILESLYGNFDKKASDTIFKSSKKLSKKVEKFKKDWGISFKNFAVVEVYYSANGYRKSNAVALLNQAFGKSIPIDNWSKIHDDFLTIQYEVILKSNLKAISENMVSKLLSPINIAKKIASLKRLSTHDAIPIITDMLKETVKDSGKAILKGVIQSAIKQATFLLVSGGSGVVLEGPKIADMANELIGIGGGMFLTPSVVPFAIEVDKNGKVTYKHPLMRVKGAINNLIPKDSNNFLILSKQDNDTSPLVITSSDKNHPFKYDLSYKILFENSANNLEGLLAANSNWDNSLAIYADMKIQEYSNDRLDGTLLLKNGRKNNATWFISPEEASSQVKSNKGGSEIDLISILNKQDEGFFQHLFSSTRSTTVSNFSRGIFNESFNYKIYEPKDSPVAGKATKIKSFERNIFKIANAKDLRKGIKLYEYDDKHVAITNDTGHGIIIYNNLEEYYLANGETKLYVKNFFHSIKIADSILKEYGKSKGLKSLDSTIDYLSTIKDNFNIDYIVNANKVNSAKEYSCILSVEQDSFTDVKPNENINIVKSDDFLSILKNSKLKTILYYDNTKQAYSYLYPLAQYQIDSEVKFPTSSIYFSNTKNSSIITTAIPSNLNGSKLNGNYKIKDLSNFTMNIELDEYERIAYVTFVKDNIKIDSMITEYEHTEDGDRMILEISDGSKNFFECIKKECPEFPKRGDSIYLLLSTIKSDYIDSDKDGIIDGLDKFPEDINYQSDSDQDGMPDSWEVQYGLNPNDPTDATKDLNGNNKTNLQEFKDGTNPKNHIPTANAGADQTIKEGESVILDASGSSDVEDDADALTYIWTWKSDTDNSTLEKEAKSFEVAGLKVGVHTFTLTVADTEGASSSDEVKVTVESNAMVNLNKGLVAYYKFDEQNGATTLIDSSGNHNDGTIHGGVAFVDGVIGKAGSFDGVDDYVEIKKHNFNITDSISVSLWRKSKNDAMLLQWGEACPDGDYNYKGTTLRMGILRYYELTNHPLNEDRDKFTVNINSETGNYYDPRIFSVSKEAMKEDEYEHLLFVFKNKVLTLYKNGKIISQYHGADKGSSVNTEKISLDEFKKVFISNATIKIGVNESYCGYKHEFNSFLNGKLDDLRIYNRALNEVEIKELYKMGNVDKTVNLNSGLVADYEFDNGFINSVTGNDDSKNWENSENITLKNGYLKLINNYDGDKKRYINTVVDTAKTNVLIIEKKTKLTTKDNYTQSGTSFHNSHGERISIEYNNYHYNNGDLSHTIDTKNNEHFYIYNRWNYVDANNFKYKLSDLLPTIWNQWFYEKIIIDFKNKKAIYKISNDGINYQQVSILNTHFQRDSNTTLSFGAWDWASGSEHYIDYLKIHTDTLDK